LATARSFAYNAGTGVTGTTQVGFIAAGNASQNYGSGLTWWNGPDEDLGYVICHTSGGRTAGQGTINVPSPTIGFWRSAAKTDPSFLTLCNNLFGQNFSDTSTAKTWLNTNGYWTSYAASIVTTNLALHLDAGNTSSYPGSGSTWTDLIASRAFTLYNSPTYSSSNGGYLSFTPSSSQYAASTTSLSSLSNWTVEAWHYYTGTNSSGSPCIVTEVWPNSTGNLNYTLGNGSDSSPNLQAGFFNGAWRLTPTGYTLTANNWYQVVGTYDGSTIKLYVNNSMVQSTAYTGTAATGTQGIVLMRRWDLGQYQGGRLGVVRIYSSALNSTQVSQNWNAQKSRFGL